MATTITIGSASIDYRDFRVKIPLSPRDIAPKAEVQTTVRETISAGDDVSISVDGTTIFSGYAKSSGEKRQSGGRKVSAEHDAVRLFEESVTVSLTNPTDEQVLNAAIADSSVSASFSLSYSGTPTSMGDDYNAAGRPVSAVFRDVVDRTGRVWWVEPGTSGVIHVEPLGGRGQWTAIDPQADPAGVVSFNEGDVSTVRNDVTVYGTGGQLATGTASDATSISSYGTRSASYNYDWIRTSGTADAVASELLVPDPLAEGEVLVGSGIGDILSARVNQTVDLTDTSKNINATGLVVEEQTIEQGRATLKIGEGSGTSIENVNRKSKSQGDNAKPGSVYDSDRIADGAITNQKIVDLAITETKISDNSISTPKLQANSVRANEIATNTITAAEIDTLNLSTNELTVGSNTAEQIEYDVETVGGTNYPTLQPSADLGASLGLSSNRFRSARIQDIIGSAISLSGDITPLSATPSGTGVTFQITDDGGAALITSVAGVGYVGTSSSYFNEMHATNFVTHSPPSYDAAGGRDVREWDVGSKDVPEFGRVDGGEDGSPGLSLPNMVSMLVGVCQEQADELESLRDRVVALEDGG